MLNIPDSVKALFKQDGVRKNFRTHFPNGELPDITNENIVQESVKFTESVCSQDVFKFGLTEASVIEFETVGVANMYGMTIEAGIEIDLSSLSAEELAEISAGSWDGVYVSETDTDIGFPFFRVPYGIFTVDKCPRNHETMAHRQVTAYSHVYADLDAALPSIPATFSEAALVIDPSAIIAQETRANLLNVRDIPHSALIPSVVEKNTGTRTGDLYLYDSSRKKYRLTFTGSDCCRYQVYNANTNAAAYYASRYLADFAYMNIPGFDFQTASQNGETIAANISALGLDLSYNDQGKKVYADNYTAVLNIAPMAFGPTVCGKERFSTPASGSSYTVAMSDKPAYYYHMKNDILYPCINDSNMWGSTRSKAFTYPAKTSPTNLFFIGDPGIYLFMGSVTVELFDVSGNRSVTSFTLTYPSPTYADDDVTFYQLVDYSSTAITVPNTGNLDNCRATFTDSVQATSIKAFPMYSYLKAFDRSEIAGRAYELAASFGKVTRDGNVEQLRLDNTNPEAIIPQEYRQMWWDEFDVQPIGTVTYKIASDQLAIYQFGPGQSVYDMTDNDLFVMIPGAEAETIQAVLDEEFIPNLGAVQFTPIDLEMKAFPYLEAGDAVVVTAEDGTIVESYIMRQEISGVQVLEAQIDSQGGLIIESEAAT